MLLCAIALLAIAMSVGLAEARMHKRMVPGVHGGQAGGCAMRVRYGSWPPIGVPEGAMVQFHRLPGEPLTPVGVAAALVV